MILLFAVKGSGEMMETYSNGGAVVLLLLLLMMMMHSTSRRLR